ncbi:50S ribosomal protein L4 [Angelakisella massiliensis]|uniref:50S ribosomal protein L4 n=1 Tax=Angelakisella massiliensis TaxID=1871018 RepID=UPI0008F834F7|nr:50S ribosomal protein L4 [Angelakisella massiliensis]
MPKVTIYDMTGKSVGERDLSDAIFAIEPNKYALHAVVKNYLANQRQGTQSTLTRTEVRGGGRKPWRQKGTGHARQGSIRAPQWTHGGVALGPKPRSYNYTLNKKVKVLALKSALSSKVLENELVVVDNIAVEDYKTKTVVAMLSALGAGKKAMIVTAAPDAKLIGSANNIPGVKTAVVGALNAYDILNTGKFIISAEAVDKLEEVYK